MELNQCCSPPLARHQQRREATTAGKDEWWVLTKMSNGCWAAILTKESRIVSDKSETSNKDNDKRAAVRTIESETVSESESEIVALWEVNMCEGWVYDDIKPSASPWEAMRERGWYAATNHETWARERERDVELLPIWGC